MSLNKSSAYTPASLDVPEREVPHADIIREVPGALRWIRCAGNQLLLQQQWMIIGEGYVYTSDPNNSCQAMLTRTVVWEKQEWRDVPTVSAGETDPSAVRWTGGGKP